MIQKIYKTRPKKKNEVNNSLNSGLINSLHRDPAINLAVKKQLRCLGTREDDIQTLFNLTIIRYIDLVKKKKNFKIEYSLEKYLCIIAKYICWEEQKAFRKNFQSIEHLPEQVSDCTPETILFKSEEQQKIQALLQNLSQKCREVISYWSEGYKMQEIAILTGYASASMARKKKCEAMKVLVKRVSEMA